MSSGLVWLFVGSLLASTLVPGGVEVLLYSLYQSGQYGVVSLLLVATVGNTLGGIITWWVGTLLYRGLAHTGWHERIGSVFKLSDTSLDRVRKWGVPVLFFSWMPVVGDPLCLAAGYLRLPFWPCTTMILLGKLARYAALLWIFSRS